MEPALKTRLIGAAVLVALAVIVVPMFFSGQPRQRDSGKSVSLTLPPSPDQELSTRTMSVAPPPTTSVVAPNTSNTDDSDHLATVDVPSRRPVDVHPENDKVPAKTPAPTRPAVKKTPAPSTPKPAPTAKSQAPAPGVAAKGAYLVTLGAYTNSANARDLMRRVRALGYPVHADKVTAADKVAARISAGPFATRVAAETARLRLKQAIPSAPARLMATTGNQTTDASASALPAGRAGGWAVQVGAYSQKNDAMTERTKLRASGFDGYIDQVSSGGRTLWRVRVGPQTQRADAEKIRDELKSRLKVAGVVVTVP